MRYALLLLSCLVVATAQADVFKCLSPAGKMVFSDIPCDEGETFEKVLPSESVSDPVAARQALERQRAYAEQRAAENEAARKSTEGAASLPEYISPPLSSPTATSSSSSSSSGASAAGPQPRDTPPLPSGLNLPRSGPPVSR